MHAFLKFSLGWRWRWRQQCHTFAYLTMNDYSFARFVRAFFHFSNNLLPFSSFPRPEMMCFKFAVMCNTWRHHEKFSFFFSSYLQTADTYFIPGCLEGILHAKWLGIFEKWSQKLEAPFLDDVLAVVDVVLAHFLSSIHALNLRVIVFFNVLFGLRSVDKCAKKITVCR